MDKFQASDEHAPRSKTEAYKRLHYYVSKMGVTISDQLQLALIDLRRNAHQLPEDGLQKLAIKGFRDDEFVPAVKEILCIWLHLEAIDQGGEKMPDWLLTFLRLAFGATDYMIPRPTAADVMGAYEHTSDLTELCLQSSVKVAQILGFGEHARIFAPSISPVLLKTEALRQQILQKALMLPAETILKQTDFS